MSSTAVEFGIINTLRTGHTMVDTMLCMLIPAMIQWVVRLGERHGLFDISNLFDQLLKWLFGDDREGEVHRVIEFKQRYGPSGNGLYDDNHKNNLLQKALSNYFMRKLKLTNEDARYELMEKRQPLCESVGLVAKNSTGRGQVSDTVSDLSTTDESVWSGRSGTDHHSVSDSDRDSDSDSDTDSDDEVSGVQKLNVGVLPPLEKWVEVEPGVWFMHDISNEDTSKGSHSQVSEVKTSYRFRSRLPDASQRIDRLLERAFQRYKERERRRCARDQSRYMYILCSERHIPSSREGDVPKYKRYALGEEKTFENLFFEGKTQVLQLLDSFVHRTGKFAVKGFPHKLGLLLHGPPGTGKTSLIKAVAQYTKRHIVTIPLARIKTNQELLDQLFDLEFRVDDMDYTISMNFKDVVFVMEDIDCASSVVMSRSKMDEKSKRTSTSTSTTADVDTDMNEHSHTTDSLSSVSRSTDDRLVSMLLKAALPGGREHNGDDTDAQAAWGIRPIRPWWESGAGADELNLSGLLNVLDGIIDCPGRIVIMTTNHPEKLDPALIRPGRVNKQVLLDYVSPRQIVYMLEYYFSTTLSSSQVALVESYSSSCVEKKWTPAQIEQLCAEFDELEDTLQALATLPSFAESVSK